MKRVVQILGFTLPIMSLAQSFDNPQTRKFEHTDIYHGTTVADHYRWLDDDRSAKTAESVKQQNTMTFRDLDKIPYRQAF